MRKSAKDELDLILLKIKEIKSGKIDSLDYIYEYLSVAIKGIAKKYYLPGGDNEDIIQIIKIGIYEGINDFDESKVSNPISFLKICGERNLTDAIRESSRVKRRLSNTSVSLNDKIMNNNWEEVELGELIADSFLLDEYIEEKETNEMIKNEIYSKMSYMEKMSLSLRMDGYSYEEICDILKADKKQVDNAIQRAKKQIKNNKILRKIYA